MIKYIISLIIILFAIGVVVLGIVNYNSRYSELPNKDSFSFLNQFPYEMQDNETMKYNLPFKLLTALFGASYAVFGMYLFFFSNAYGYRSFHEYILGSIFIILGISIFCNFVISLKNYRQHLFNISLLFALTVINYIYLGFFILLGVRPLYNTALAYVLFVLGASLLASLIFTPLKRWMYLEKEEKDGTVKYYRKRISILPFMEWIFLSANVLLIIILTIF
ncbi:unknown [Firmicutes bacterium CAG:449]|nr:unknown [Firmicutes bacterium CAG:449]